jgi:hypothetical protein
MAYKKPTNDEDEDNQESKWQHSGDNELRELVSVINIIWPQVTPVLKRQINEQVLHRLRYLDYFARQKLLLLMTGLMMEQRATRPQNEGFEEQLHGLVGLIDRVERNVTQDDLTERLSSAVFRLPREEQKKLLETLEQRAKNERTKNPH